MVFQFIVEVLNQAYHLLVARAKYFCPQLVVLEHSQSRVVEDLIVHVLILSIEEL